MADPLFFALWPDAEVRGALQQLRQGLLRHCGREPHPADHHITLVYLGPLSVGQRDCAEQVAGGIRAEPFSLHIDSLGFWRRSAILWCAPGEVPASLCDLVAVLKLGLADCGMELDQHQHPFRPHITLARKVPRGLGGAEIDAFQWPVTEFVLAAGRQGQRPRYQVLARWPLEP